jgi:hypothetical protein
MKFKKMHLDISDMHRSKPYDPAANANIPTDFEVRHPEFTIRFKEAGLRDIAEFNEISIDDRKEFWSYLQDSLPKKIVEDSEKGTLSVSKDPVKAIQAEVEAFRKDRPNFPKLTNEEVEKLFQQI